MSKRRGGGYTHVHRAIDAYSRVAYSQFAGTENAVNFVAFLERAVAWFDEQGKHETHMASDVSHCDELASNRKAQPELTPAGSIPRRRSPRPVGAASSPARARRSPGR